MPPKIIDNSLSFHQADCTSKYIENRIRVLSEGSFGAAQVLCDLFKEKGPEQFKLITLKLEKERVLGSLIWERYKKDCGEDLGKFIRATDDAANRNKTAENLMAAAENSGLDDGRTRNLTSESANLPPFGPHSALQRPAR